jgi:hypothetical protein
MAPLAHDGGSCPVRIEVRRRAEIVDQPLRVVGAPLLVGVDEM